MPDNKELRQAIQTALSNFEGKPLADAACELFKVLGYQSDKTLPIKPNTADQFQAMFDPRRQMKAEAKLEEWQSVDLLFQVTGDELGETLSKQGQLFANQKVDNALIESYLFFAIALKGNKYSRTELANITREVNRCFKMPALVIFKHGGTLTFSIIARRISKRDASKDVLEKVTLIKDIRAANPHRAHIEILHDLALAQLAESHPVKNFVDLQRAWEKTLDTAELNKKFYKEVANWYFWAVKSVTFPKDAGPDEATRNAISVIRLITRLIFVWFIKEKGLVPEDLFDPRRLQEILDFSDPKKSAYYKAILQNLFFATLNTEMGAGREFRRENTQGRDPDYLMSNFYRYKRYFKDADKALSLFARIPFLNGGLFECLDKEDEKDVVIRVDGFSDRDDNPLTVPDDLFLMEKEKEIDLNEIYDTKNKKYKVRGLIHVFNSYKFTIEENTPIEEEIALDPELLGKVFENLLAAYNPETGTTARKQTGSFYTPREIVNYMVDEALVAYLDSAMSLRDGALPSKQSPANNKEIAYPSGTMSQKTLAHGPDALTGMTDRIRVLLAYTPEPPQFTEAEKTQLITAIDNVKVLDPACGSGAFPMGILHKLVFLLGKLDPNNERWKQRQLDKAYEMPSVEAREASIKSTEDVFENNYDDYGRKLYLIENCIYGVDIQPIAVQIAKLRFFISLVVDQKGSPSPRGTCARQGRGQGEEWNLGIRPLPNLETKFVAANTLIGINRPDTKPVDEALSSISPEVEEACDLLIRKLEQYLKSRNPDLRARYITEAQQYADAINAGMGGDFQPLSVDWIFTTAKDTAALKALLPVKREVKATMQGYRSQDVIEKERELERVRRDHFSARTPKTKRQAREKDKELREEIATLLKQGGWEDATAQQLANWDPYNQNAHADFFDPEWMFGIEGGFDVVIGNPPYVRQEQISEFKPVFQKQYSCYTGTADLYVYFYEKGIRLLQKNGVLVYISSNKYFRSSYGEILRNHIATSTKINQLIDFGDTPVFTAIAYPSIIVLQNNAPFQNSIRILNWESGQSISNFESIYQEQSFLINQTELTGDGWRLENQIALRLLDKLKKSGRPLGEHLGGEFYRGVVTGNNNAFVVGRTTRDELIAEDLASKEILKPYIRGRDINRWTIDNPDLWLIFTRRGIDIKKYPAIHKHLLKYKESLMPGVEGGRKPGSYMWHEIQDNTAYWQEFEKPKILYQEIATYQQFAFDESGAYASKTGFFIPTDDLALLGLLNSSAIWWFLKNICNRLMGGALAMQSIYIEQIPIPPNLHTTSIRTLVTQILAAKRANPTADTSKLEDEINQLVYQLYGLTEEEIGIVEGNS
jgi:hypothetical protein